jgi:hypothetical protein
LTGAFLSLFSHVRFRNQQEIFAMRCAFALMTALCLLAPSLFAQELQEPRKLPARMETSQTPKLLSFDYRALVLDWEEGHWKLRSGNTLIKDFERNEAVARTAMRVIRDLQLNQYGTIGTPRPVIEYWLSDGHAPRGYTNGQFPIPFNPSALRVDAIQGQWCVLEGGRILFAFGSHEEQARQALGIIRNYGFNQVGFLGAPTPVMMYFTAGPGQEDWVSKKTPLQIKSRDALRGNPANIMQTGGALGVQPKIAQAERMDMVSFGKQLSLPQTTMIAGKVTAESIPIHWRQVRLKNENQQWKLVDQDFILADFGAYENDARTALRLVQTYHFTEQCRIGDQFRYFLTNGQAPRGSSFGMDMVPFQPSVVRVIPVGREFAIADGGRIIALVGAKESDAKSALAAIQHYRFDHLCRVGINPEHSLTFFIKSF